jgi:hypothetical protein
MRALLENLQALDAVTKRNGYGPWKTIFSL